MFKRLVLIKGEGICLQKLSIIKRKFLNKISIAIG